MRTAVIDIGTNTLLLLIVEPEGPKGAGLRRVVDLCRFGRLGQGLDASGRLHDEAITRSLSIAREYRATMDSLGVGRTVVVGTQALREAANAAEFVTPAEEILGAPIEVIAGAREAELAFLAVARSLPGLAGAPFVVADVGGGSTEIIASDGARVTSAVSVPIGAVRLAERHLKHDPPTRDDLEALHGDIDRHLAALTLPAGATLVATAGTATTMAAVELGMKTYDPDRVHGTRLASPRIDAMMTMLVAMTTAERRALAGMEPQRADVIPAGGAIFARLVHRLGSREVVICDRGIRWGVAYELAERD